ncbi:MAG: DUF4239 domain-containing protein [Kiritimatiellaceae bacterium]|nr:DUF4239 domain-containing protein [Kiritimatiellaceae bacterium]
MLISIECGFQVGQLCHRRSEDEKESPVSAMAGSILGLLAFMLAISFGIVTDRFDARKALVREEANAIRTTYLRADFMEEPDRSTTQQQLRDYLDDRLEFVQSKNIDQAESLLADASRIHRQLWDIAVIHARKDMNSDVAALYVDSLNDVINIHSLRVSAGLLQRVPAGIWVVLFSLIFFGMAAIGYQAGIAGSKRSWSQHILALSFSMVILLIVVLDRPQSRFINVSQQPLIDLRQSMAADEGK